jgi:hypothetical protein
MSSIADGVGVSWYAIEGVRTGRTWSHLTEGMSLPIGGPVRRAGTSRPTYKRNGLPRPTKAARQRAHPAATSASVA